MYNILVVDDDKEIVNAIEIYLSKEGYNILKAYDGMEALKIVEKNDNIHLILLDIMMPKLDGISTANLIRKDKSIPIIMLSAIEPRCVYLRICEFTLAISSNGLNGFVI